MRALVLLLAASLPASAAVPRVVLGKTASPLKTGPGTALTPVSSSLQLPLPVLKLAPLTQGPAPHGGAPLTLETLSAELGEGGESQAALLGRAFDGGLPADDAKGTAMAAAMADSRSMAVGERRSLAFKPSVGSLRALGRHEGYEVMVGRTRDGRWTMIKGDTSSVPGVSEDFEAYYHNHYYHPVYAKSFTPYPSDPDLVFSAGKDARFFVVSDSGVVEWSPKVPYYPYSRSRLSEERKARLLDPASDKDHDWRRRFRSGNAARAALNWILPAFYGSLLKASGIDFTLYRWSDKRLTQDFIDRRPEL